MNIGLALSGGGMRGIAHIGTIKALEDNAIYPTHISGSSAGAIVGALYAYGYQWSDIFNFFKEIQILDFKKYAMGKPGFLDAEKFYPELHTLIKNDNFDALKKKLFVSATDILNGNLKTFDSGQLIRPILGSAAFPGVFSPVNIENAYYIDGGALDNFPIRPLQKECDIIIGSYVNGYDKIDITDLKHSYNVVERAFKLRTVQEDYQKFNDCNLIVAPTELDGYGTFEKKNLQTIFKIGYNATIEALDYKPELKLKLATRPV